MDLAVVTTPVEPEKGMGREDLRTVREVAVCSVGLGLFPHRAITPEELAEYPMVSLGRDTMTYRLYEQWFHENGLPFITANALKLRAKGFACQFNFLILLQHYKIASTYSFALKACRSSMPSPTPM